jgi:hypothetical protein
LILQHAFCRSTVPAAAVRLLREGAVSAQALTEDGLPQFLHREMFRLLGSSCGTEVSTLFVATENFNAVVFLL